MAKSKDFARVNHKLYMKKGFILGLIASLITFSGDMLLGYIQVENPEKSLMNFSLTLPLSRIMWGGFLGVIGIPLQCIGYWQIYKLMKESSETLSKLYKVGYLGVAGNGSLWGAP